MRADKCKVQERRDLCQSMVQRCQGPSLTGRNSLQPWLTSGTCRGDVSSSPLCLAKRAPVRVLCESSHSPASMEGCSDKGLKGGSTYVAVKYTSGIVSCECCIKDKVY